MGEGRGLRAYAKKRNYWDLSSASSYYLEETFTDSPQRENTGKLYKYTATMHNSSGRNGQHPWFYDSAIYKHHAIASTL